MAKDNRRTPRRVRKLRIQLYTRNWGIIAAIARQTGFSQSYVSMVASGQRHNPAIYDALKEAARKTAARRNAA